MKHNQQNPVIYDAYRYFCEGYVSEYSANNQDTRDAYREAWKAAANSTVENAVDPDHIRFLGVLNYNIQRQLGNISPELELLIAAQMEKFVVRDARGHFVRGEDGRISKHADFYNQLNQLVETIRSTEKRERMERIKEEAFQSFLHIQNQNLFRQLNPQTL